MVTAVNVIPVILCGGAGNRLWPLSREASFDQAPDQTEKYPPKHLHALIGDKSLLQNTVSRVAAWPKLGKPLLVCNQAQGEAVAAQLREIAVVPSHIILEPEGRNTAPAVALAAQLLMMEGADALMVVMPSDHALGKPEALQAGLEIAFPLAEAGQLVTFGIVPDRPETGYGYIRRGAAVGRAFQVDRFVEKPDQDTAEAWFKSGDHYWNSGIFVFRASVYLEELARHRPDIASFCKKGYEKGYKKSAAESEQSFVQVDEAAFCACPAESVDRAVMEHTSKALVIPLDADWSDLGSWNSLWQIAEKDADGNSLTGDVVASDVSNTYVRAGHRLVSVVGVSDLVIVETEDAVLVTARDQAQKVMPPKQAKKP